VRRTKAPTYDGYLSLSNEPRIELEVNPKLNDTQQAWLFDVSDRLADAFHPDIGITHVWRRVRAVDKLDDPWATDDERDAELMYRAALLSANDYYATGPYGLGMRTYLGPHYVEQFGREQIESLPLVVTKLAWGGYRIDLVAEPWKANVATLVAAWRAGMSHLSAAKVFAEPIVRNGRLAGYSKGELSVIGGEVGV
jgi:hypothetical protein